MTTYTGGCHCGAVRFTVSMDLGAVIECNCSHCEKKGLLLAFVPAASFTLTEGDDSALTEYRFNQKKIKHLFCPTCGVQSYGCGENAEGAETVAVNVRCLDNVTLANLERMPYDGKSR